jgi:hypothetical protein
VTWTHHRARVAVLSRDRASDDPELLDERRKLREARLADYITRTVDAYPPLTGEARARLSALLRDEPGGLSATDTGHAEQDGGAGR